jgi:hypothetical protein
MKQSKACEKEAGGWTFAAAAGTRIGPIREAPPIFLKIGEVQPNLDFQPKLDFIMW